MSKIIAVPVSLFLSMVEQIAAEKPAYKLGHDGSDGLCDCIGLVRGALKRAGANPTNMRGTNEAARKSICNLNRIHKTTDLQLGQVVLKIRDKDDPDYPLPSKYREGGNAYNGDLTNYTHIGVVSGISPLRITHMTSPTARHDTRLGKWRYAGDLPWITTDTDTGGVHMTAKISADNGQPVRVRMAPGGDTITKLPVGTEVEIITSGPEWSVIQYSGGTGYIMTEFLNIENGSSETVAAGITVTFSVEEAEQIVKLADKIVNQIGRG